MGSKISSIYNMEKDQSPVLVESQPDPVLVEAQPDPVLVEAEKDVDKKEARPGLVLREAKNCIRSTAYPSITTKGDNHKEDVNNSLVTPEANTYSTVLPDYYKVRLYCCTDYKSSIKKITTGVFVKEPCPLISENMFYNKGVFPKHVFCERNVWLKKDVLASLDTNTPVYNVFNFVSKAGVLASEYKYCFQADFQRAFYTFKLETVYKLLKKYISNPDIYNYLISFYGRIHHSGEEDYLYISDYSEYIFNLFLKDILPEDFKFISYYDDVLVFGDSLDSVKEKFAIFEKVVAENNMFINKSKTKFSDLSQESLIILNTVISTPKNVYDDRFRSYIEDNIANNQRISLYKSSPDSLFYINHVLKKTKTTQPEIVFYNKSC